MGCHCADDPSGKERVVTARKLCVPTGISGGTNGRVYRMAQGRSNGGRPACHAAGRPGAAAPGRTLGAMAVLIDPPLWPKHGTVWSHLVSDSSIEELTAFAERAGTPRRG